jgi:integrase/recombinase XerD
MNCDYIPAKLVQRACTGPLAPCIEPYIALMKQAGYVPSYVRENLTVLGAFGRRLERWALGVEDLDEDVVDRFVRKRYPGRRPPRHVRPTLRRLLAMVRDMGIARPGPEARPLSPAERLLSEYKQFLVKERAISTSTVDRWSRVELRFLAERFGSGAVDTGTLTASDITGFVQRQAPLHGHSMARSLVVAMRSFLRYLEYKGLTALSLDKAVPAVATWTMSTLPKYLSFEQVQAVLDHCDRSTKSGSTRLRHSIATRSVGTARWGGRQTGARRYRLGQCTDHHLRKRRATRPIAATTRCGSSNRRVPAR